MKKRVEQDCVGVTELDQDVYFGINTLRARENFPISGEKPHLEMIKALAEIKKAAAISNFEAGILEKSKCDAIKSVCDEIISGKLHEYFIVDPIQGGAGTSINMNANEVIANRALEILGHKLGNYELISPNDHVNMSQSTNDVFPSAGKIAAIRLIDLYILELRKLEEELNKKSDEFDDVLKIGRTQLQDAVPMRLGQSFSAFSSSIKRDIKRLELAKNSMRVLNLGASAIGTAINVHPIYLSKIIPNLAEITSLDLSQAENLFDATQNQDDLVFVSGIIKSSAINLSKMANDIRLLSSGPKAGIGEIIIPARQNGSSIMPGKINPVIPEVVSQVAFHVVGCDAAITMAAEAGQLELNAFEPIIFYSLYSSLDKLRNVVETFMLNCIVGIVANRETCMKNLESTTGIATALTGVLGYKLASEIAKESLETNISVREIVMSRGLVNESELDKLLDAYSMTEPKTEPKTGE